MQAVLLAAGQSSRLFPFGGKMPKAGLTLMGKPLIVKTIESLRQHGVDEIIIVVSPQSPIETLVTSHFNTDDKIRFVVHEGARGMGEALLDTKDLLQEEFFLLHAHHFECGDFLEVLQKQKKSSDEAVLLVKKENIPEDFGVVELKEEKVISIVEKPKDNTRGKYRIVGIYLLSRDFISALSKAPKDHYSFETALDGYAQNGHVSAVKTTDSVITLKYPWHILDVSDYLLSRVKRSISSDASVAATAVLEGKVIISAGVIIEDGAVIKGPCFLGENAYVGTHAILRGGVIVERGAKIGANMELKHAVIMEQTTTHSGYIGDSVFAKDSKVAAFFCSGNVRIDRQNVKVRVKEERVDSGKKSLGVFVGEGTKFGIRVSTMPGVLIGSNVTIGPSTAVFKNIQSDTSYYTKVTEVIEEQKKSNAFSSQDPGKEKVVLFDIDYTLFNTDVFKESNLTTFSLYEEVIEVLGALGSFAKLGIFSEGETELQQAKLLKTEVEAHFLNEHIHIVSKKSDTIEDILGTYKNSELFLVDDRLSVLFRAKQLYPDIYVIWVKRGPFARDQAPIEGFSPDAIVDDLRMVLPIVAGV